ncbi:hypothetical protein SADUNF_Sadunf09G0020400 [Salix dunnii]|uniref:Uncharacterized protein n=1 Tax=Salix dunnii TaxID=1413687 RepID=A0A835JX94_9ROSI|nr:hypothetical protein SADUNF_Sadunf09G0020400 [Salix dunnii]
MKMVRTNSATPGTGQAVASPTQRRNLLQELFADIALEVDDRARGLLEEDAISPVDADGQLCFFNLLADYYVWVPESGKQILHLILQLWSQSFASHIFSLLFHKWLFEAQLNNTEELLRFSSALVQGATNPLPHGSLSIPKCRTVALTESILASSFFSSPTKFLCPLHLKFGAATEANRSVEYLLDEVALMPLRLNKIPVQAQRELFLLLSRFTLFYNSADKLESFLKQFPVFLNAFFIGGPADFFVIELADQLQKLKVEPVLLHYLSHIKVLQGGLELRMSTSTRLKACLYNFTSPGGPMYPTRAVRHAAWDSLDLLFPVGQYPRHLISLFFRLLYPWCWPSSCWSFIISCIKAVFYSLLRLLFSSWDKLREPKKY